MPSFGDGGGGSTAVSDSPRSVDSTNSFETLASAGGGSISLDLECNYIAEEAGAGTATTVVAAAATAGKDNGQKTGGLGVVDRTLFESWKALPWQARLCPRAIEEQEVVRRTSALETEVTR